MTAPSAWGRIVDDIVTRVSDITPTATATKRWHHLRDTKATATEQVGGAAFRQFSTIELATPGEARVAGAGERQEQWAAVLLVTYPRVEGLQGLIAADHVDLIKALAPRSTYPSGTWGRCCVRSIGEPEGPSDSGEGVEVRYPIRIIFRHPVTLV